jgi:signal transduction histidine kinase
MNDGRTAASNSPCPTPDTVLAGGGKIGVLMRSQDWSKTALGPVEAWPQSLRTAVSIVLESAIGMVVAWGPELVLLYNERYVGVLGTGKHPAAMGRPARDVFSEAWDSIGPLFRQALGGTAVARDDVLLAVERNGGREQRAFTLSYSPIREENGGVGGVLCIVAETTARIHGELSQALDRERHARALADENARVAETLSKLSASFATELDQEKLLQQITDEATALTGAQFGSFFFNHVDAEGQSYTLYTISGVPKEKFAGFQLPRATPLFGPTFRGEGTVRIDDVRLDPRFGAWGKQPKGHLPVVSYLAAPVVTGSGRVLGGLFFGHAAVGRFTAEHERIVVGIASHAAIALENARLYREAESQVMTQVHARQALEAVLTRVPVPIVLVEPGTARILFSNQSADDLWGSPLPKATSVEQYEQLFHALDASGNPLPAARHPAIRAARGEAVVAQEFDLETPRGRVMLLVDSARVPPLPGHPETIVMTFRDVTKLVLAERALREAVQVRDDFLSVASHELNTPLTPLKLHLASLLSTEWSEPVRRKLQVADRQVDRLAALVTELLEVSRITAGRMQMDPSHVDVLLVVSSVVEHVGGTNGGTHISIAGAPAFADVDVGRLEQVVTNLVTNAIKYGEGKPIDIEVARNIAEVVVRVRDHGIGIAPDKQQLIFDRFERAVSVRHFGGFGLGLWIVRQIVERWGGHVSVSSQPGQGSIFSFTIPTPVGSA